MVHVTRGFAFLHLDDQYQAIIEFTQAIAADPTSAEAWAARGLETYPAERAVADLQRAIDLGTPSYWPAYYLAHHYIDIHDWTKAEEFAALGLRLGPPSRVHSNLLEWEAIARVERGGDFDTARAQLRSALKLSPGSPRLRRNLELLDHLVELKPDSTPPWELERDAQTRTAEVQAAA